jgi:hypothetical protein
MHMAAVDIENKSETEILELLLRLDGDGDVNILDGGQTVLAAFVREWEDGHGGSDDVARLLLAHDKTDLKAKCKKDGSDYRRDATNAKDDSDSYYAIVAMMGRKLWMPLVYAAIERRLEPERSELLAILKTK